MVEDYRYVIKKTSENSTIGVSIQDTGKDAAMFLGIVNNEYMGFNKKQLRKLRKEIDKILK